jgi:hypothetical protein
MNKQTGTTNCTILKYVEKKNLPDHHCTKLFQRTADKIEEHREKCAQTTIPERTPSKMYACSSKMLSPITITHQYSDTDEVTRPMNESRCGPTETSLPTLQTF